MGNGAVQTKARRRTALPARNFPMTRCGIGMGRLNASSRLLSAVSSPQDRMANAGTSTRQTQGRKMENKRKEASSEAKKSPTKKMPAERISVKAHRKIAVRGE